MTDIHFRYLSQTRTLQDRSQRYAGQQCDAGSTRLHLDYDPIGYLEMYGFTPYIVFNVIGPDGNPMVYGPNSTSRFDGYRFDLPWDLTSRIKQARVEFQLFLVKPNVTVDDETDVPKLDSTDYELSSITGIAFRPSIVGKRRCDPGCPPLPTTEPNLMGLMDVFMDYGILVPVKAQYNESTRRLEMVFHTYYGDNDQTLELNVPVLSDEGTIEPEYLPIIQAWLAQDGTLQATQENIPSALLTYNALMQKSDKVRPIPDWVPTTAYEAGALVTWRNVVYRAASASQGVEPQMGSTAWIRMLDLAQIATNLDNPTAYTIPSTMLLSSELNKKFDKADVIDAWNDKPSETQVPSEVLVRYEFASVTDYADSKVSDEWEEPLPTDVAPSERLVREALDAKTDIAMAIPEWSDSVEYQYQSTVIYEGVVYISTANGNVGNIPGVEDMWWTPITSNGGSSGGGSSGTVAGSTYMAVIGDGESTEFTIEHPLGTENVTVELRTSDTRAYVRSTVQVLDKDRIKVSFRHAPAADGIIVLIASYIASPDAIVMTLGNGTDSSFTIEHNWGTYNVFAQLRMVADGMLVYSDVTAISPSQVRVDFAHPPAQDSIVLCLAPCIPSSTVNGFTFTQSTPSDNWVINHGLNRVVAVYTMTLDGEEMSGYVKQDMTTLNSVTIQFSEPVTGVAYLR